MYLQFELAKLYFYIADVIMNSVSKNKSIIISKKEITNIVSAELTSDNIIEVKWNPHNDEIEKQHLIELKSLIKELGGGKKMLIYVETFNFMSITAEARQYASTTESSEYTLANAVLVDSLGKKILFNFFMNITTPVVPTKGFNSKEDAIEWLNKLQ